MGLPSDRGEIKKMPQETLTTEQLMERARETVQQMTPEEKAKVREMLEQSLQKDALKRQPCSPVIQ
jgi:hypothetical protein